MTAVELMAAMTMAAPYGRISVLGILKFSWSYWNHNFYRVNIEVIII